MDLTDKSQAFGDLLRRHRVLAGMSQEELAERASLSARAISDLERGVKRTPRRDTVQLLVEALGLSGEARTAFVTAAREPATRRTPKQASQPQLAVEDAPMYPHGSIPPTGGFLGAVPESSLIGREAEFSAILAAIEAVIQGSGRLLVVAGEPGVGKTRLSQEAMLACRDRGFVVATGRCYEPHQSVPYYPFLEALSSLYSAAPDPVRAQIPTRWSHIVRLLPGQPSEALPATSASPQEEQQRLFWAVTGFLQTISDTAPVALLLDDLHWADEASLELLQHLVRHTRARRVLLLGTYRDVEIGRQHPLGRALRDLERERLVERIPVRRLGHEGTVRLISDRMGQDLPDEFTELVHRHTDGHPLFVQEVLRALIERSDVYRRDGRWESREITEIGVPESVRATIVGRASRLSERAQEALREASVLGQTFDFEDLQAMADLSEDELEAALEEALAAGLVYESGDSYVFNHALTQQALYTELSKRRRRRLHLAAGEALERLSEPVRRRRAAELAWHFREGGAPERTLPYTLLAGDHAASVYAPADAERHYRTALELARALDDRDGEARSLEKLGWLMWMMARFDSCLDALEQAARLYRDAGDTEGEMRAVGLLGMVHFTYAPLEGAERIHALLDRLGPREPSMPLVSLYSSLSMNFIIAGRYREALDATQSAAEIVRSLGDERTLAWVETMRGPALGLMGRLEEARQVLEEGLQLAEAANDYFGQLSAAHYLGNLTVPQGDFDAALHYHGRALELAERLGAQSRISAETSNLSEVLFYLGDWARACNYAERAVELARSASSGLTASYFQYANVFRRLGMIRAVMGEWEDAVPCLEESVTLAERIPYPEAVRSGQGVLAEQELLRGQPGAALARLEPMVGPSNPEEQGIVRLLPYLAWAYLELGDRVDRAEEVVLEGIERARAQGHRLALVDLLRVRGMVLSRRRSWDEAERTFEEGVRVARSIRYRYAEARALYEWGLMYGSSPDPKRGRDRLEEAAGIFRRMGARPYSDLAQKAMTRLGPS